MKLPVTRRFNPDDVVGVYDTESAELVFVDGVAEGSLSLSWVVDPKDVVERGGIRFVKKMKLIEVAVV